MSYFDRCYLGKSIQLTSNFIFIKLKVDEIESYYETYSRLFAFSNGFDRSRTSVEILDVMSSFLYIICTKMPKCKLWSVISEECCLAIALSLNALFSSISYREVVCVYSPKRLPNIGYICSFLLDLILASFSN
ncbi:hypothetical protein EWB00_009645 [Schistosoma japonicum]|uniref:TTI1 N-terminal TPR domain-containing protein n=1 Tax=Schistosoma japonicum TaxID=6182 RepID=A0A4Z2CM40_SCHJA|nr:hypothetical protein EWB00_009645 [Schistosoma japonicum]